MPLRLRLALWYGGLTGLVVGLVSLFAYAVHSRVHYDDFDRVLAGAAAHLAEEHAAALTLQGRSALFTLPLAPGLAARIYDRQGEVIAAGPTASLMPAVDPRTVLAATPSPPYDPLVSLAPPLVPRASGGGAFGLAREPGGGRWRLYVLPLDATGQYLVVGTPLHDVDASVAAFRALVPPLVLLGGLVAFVFSGLLAGRALRPVAALTDAARSIARSRSFSRRVVVSGRKDELGELGATFNEMLDSLEQAYQAQQRFVGDASHELRAPLTAIQANLDLLERRSDLSAADRQEAIGEAAREAQRLAQLVADLLALARADAGVPLRLERVELDRLVLETFGQARHLAHGQKLEIAALEPVLVEGDPDRLRQLFLALLDNAIKYTPTDGEVTLTLRRNGTMAETVIRDTGVGISDEDLPRVFERFYRADPARSRDPGGTGLGLAIARWITERHGGEVSLASKPGRGTTATVRLPAVG